MKILWLLLLTAYTGLAQTTEGSKPASGEYEGISGNPYFMKEWSDGVIRFSSGTVTDKFKIKFNAAQNRLLLQFSGSTFAAESKITEFVMYTKNKKDSFVFRKGFPETERGNIETFYQVLEKGQVILIRLATKVIVQEKEMLASKLSRHYQDEEEFYLFHEGTMHKINRETNPLQNILIDHRDELVTYIAQQQLKMRSADDLVKVVKKYNQLKK